MIPHTATSNDTRSTYVRNNSGQLYFDPHQLDHLVPPMKKALKFTAKATWFMMKNMVKAAFLIPRLFSKAASKPSSKRIPSPSTAFPAP